MGTSPPAIKPRMYAVDFKRPAQATWAPPPPFRRTPLGPPWKKPPNLLLYKRDA